MTERNASNGGDQRSDGSGSTGEDPEDLRGLVVAGRAGERRVSPVRPGRCACCGNPLPPPTAGQKKPRRYCRDGGGRFEDSHGVSCAKLGPAKELYEQVFGPDTLAGAAVEQLRTQLGAAAELVGLDSPLLRLLTGLAAGVTSVAEELDSTVTDALTETARATAAETEALGREAAAIVERDLARDQAETDRQALRDATQDFDRRITAAENRVDDHAKAREAALQDKATADAKAALYQEQAERAGQAATRDRERLADTVQQITALTTVETELRTQLTNNAERARTDLNGLRARAEQDQESLRTKAEQEQERLRAEFAARLQQAQDACTDRLTTAATNHSREIAQLSADHAAADHAHVSQRQRLQDRLDALSDALRRLDRADDRRSDTTPAERLVELRAGLTDLLADLDTPRAAATAT